MFFTNNKLLIKYLCKFLFNSKTFDIHIKFLFTQDSEYYTIPKMINFAIGIYKKLFFNQKVKIGKIQKYPNFKYNLQKCLLQRISLYGSNEKIIFFFEQVIPKIEQVVDNYKIDFFLHLVKCLSNLKQIPALYQVRTLLIT